jgi:hypothetical protein
MTETTERRVCPTCGQSSGDEDFCPTHGLRLVLPKQTQITTEPEPHGETEVTASPAEVPAASGERPSGTLAQFMSRLGLRKVGSPAASPGAPRPAPDPARSDSVLPAALVADGWRVAGPVRSSPAVDSWPVELREATGTTTAEFNRYRSGALTTGATYEHVMRAALPCLPQVRAHGTVDFGGARADYDVTTCATAGTALDRWFADTGPGETRALTLLPALARLLERLAAGGVSAILIEPSHLLLTEHGELHLTTAGALVATAESSTDGVLRYRPELARSTLLPACWSAPELAQQSVLSANAAVFSAGEILAQATWGQPLTLAELAAGAAPFHAIADARLARVLMGCLWPHARGRWSAEQLSVAATATAGPLPSTAPWASLAPGASSRAFTFAGESHWRLEDLLAAATLPGHWAEATNRLEEILDWADSTAWAGQAQLLRGALGDGRSRDWVLIALERSVRPDAPPTWRTVALSDEDAADSLIALAQRALAGDASERAAVRALFEADLRGAFER